MISFFTVTVFLLFSSNVQGACPDLWTPFQGSCYYLFEDPQEWAQANYICGMYKGHLVTIETKEENSFLENYVRHKQVKEAPVWIGANDIMAEGDWRWVETNEKVTFFDWYPGDPTNIYHGDPEHCVVIYSQRLDYKWVDVRCWNREHFMCETSPVDSVIG